MNFHDNDLVPIDADAAERDRIVSRFRKALDDTGMTVPMATTNLFTDPVFKDGAFTSHDPRVRAYAVQKTMRAMDLGVELGAKTYVFWGGREGAEVDAAKDAVEAIKRFREAIDFLCEYARDQKYDLRFALEAKPNEPRGDIYFPTTAAYLGFIGTLAHPEMVGVNPEVAHEHMIGLNFYHVVAQAIEAGKLFHIDLNDQKPGRFDQDLRFGSESIKALFFVVKLLEESGYDGPRHFDAHALQDGERRRRLGFRARLHAHVPHPEREGAAVPAGHARFKGCLSEIRGQAADVAIGAIQPSAGRPAQGAHVRPRSARGPAASVRAARSDGHRVAAGSPRLM